MRNSCTQHSPSPCCYYYDYIMSAALAQCSCYYYRLETSPCPAGLRYPAASGARSVNTSKGIEEVLYIQMSRQIHFKGPVEDQHAPLWNFLTVPCFVGIASCDPPGLSLQEDGHSRLDEVRAGFIHFIDHSTHYNSFFIYLFLPLVSLDSSRE